MKKELSEERIKELCEKHAKQFNITFEEAMAARTRSIQDQEARKKKRKKWNEMTEEQQIELAKKWRGTDYVKLKYNYAKKIAKDFGTTPELALKWIMSKVIWVGKKLDNESQETK